MLNDYKELRPYPSNPNRGDPILTIQLHYKLQVTQHQTNHKTPTVKSTNKLPPKKAK